MLACSPHARAQNGYPGSAHYDVAYTGGTWSSSGGPGLPLMPQSGGDSGGVNGAAYGGGYVAYGPPGYGASVSASGTITATFTWTPTAAMEPSPASTIVEEDGAASYSTYGPARGSCNDGVGDASPAGGTNASLSGTKYIVQNNPGTTFSVTCSPSATSSGPADPNGNGTYGSASVSFKATAFPPLITLTGTTIDPSDKSLHALTGQQVTALLNSPFTVSHYSWSFTGATGYNPFSTWNPSSSSSAQFVPLTSADMLLSSLSFYDAHNDNVTVNCTAIITPPSGPPLTVNVASKSITYHKPTVSWTVNQPFKNPGGNFIQPGFVKDQPPGTLGANELWGPIKITVPALFTANNTSGVGAIAQIASLNRSGVGAIAQIASLNRSNTRIPLNGKPGSYTKLSIMYNSGSGGAITSPTGLDVSFPYAYGYYQNPDGTLSYSNSMWLAQNNGFSGDGPYQSYINHDQDGGGDAWNAATASDSFNTWVMYQPSVKDNQGVIYVPLQMLTWSWGGTASLNHLNFWDVTATPPFLPGNPGITDTYPSWNLSIASPFNLGP